MRILHVNKFFYLKGGPERYMFSVADLLKANGHDVAFFSMNDEKNVACEWSKYFVNNVDYDARHSMIESFQIFKNTLYSKEAKRKMAGMLDYSKPDLVHLHTFSCQLTPLLLPDL